MNNYAVIMAGGNGTRLWPLSRKQRPKQFVKLFGENSMLIDSINRIDGIIKRENIVIVGNKNQQDLLGEELDAGILKCNILLEPYARNTAACIALAAIHITQIEDAVLAVVPSDHYLSNVDEYRKVFQKALSIAADSDKIVTIGITPTYPATGYGYLKFTGESLEAQGAFNVDQFIEKPDEASAVQYLHSGGYFWNSGMFFMKTNVILGLMKKLLPDVLSGVELAYSFIKKGMVDAAALEYFKIPSISIDYGIMEKCDKLIAIPSCFDWKDVGSFDALREISSKNEHGNAIIKGNCLAVNSSNVTVHSNKKLVALCGIDDVIIIETDDVLYLCKSGMSQCTKEIVSQLPLIGMSELE